LPGIIQAVGRRAFIEKFSVFPIEYLDDDLCVFFLFLLSLYLIYMNKNISILLLG